MAEVVLLAEVEEWFLELAEHDHKATQQVAAAIDLLETQGYTLGRPIADRIKGSTLHNLKELRPASTNIRILFIFDPARDAILLVAGDKTGEWKTWYDTNIPIAERRYADWLNRR